MKKCLRCLQLKSCDLFYTDNSPKGNSDGLRPYCKKCCAEKHKKYREISKDRLNANNREWHKQNKEKNNDRHRKWVSENHEMYLIKNKEWRDQNKDDRNAKLRIYTAEQRRINPMYRLSGNLRRRINQAIKRGTKSGSAVRDLGCTIPELKFYLESKFQPGMSWANWSRTGWHVDHIRPLASFDLTDPEQFKQAVHYTNLQPLWATDNLKKSDRICPTK